MAEAPVVATPLIDRLVAQEALVSERRLNRIRLVLLAVALGVLIPLRTLQQGLGAHQDLPFMLTALVLGLLASGLFAQHLKAPRSARIGYLAISLDFGLLMALVAAQIPDGYYALVHQSVDTYVLLVPFGLVINALSGLRLSRRQAWFSGALCALLVVEVMVIDVVVHRGPFFLFTGAVLAVLVAVSTRGALAMVEKTRSLIARGSHEAAEAERIKDVFARYVSRSVAETILETPYAINAGRRQRVSVLFADIRGFTRMAEKMSPEAVVSLLNRYFSCMVAVVFEHDGMLDKYLGDGMMAIFGAPIQHEDHALRAVLTALQMRDQLTALNQQLAEAGLPTLEVGIGIHTGEVIVGNIGTEQRLDYTAIGDTVNTASRIEGLTKEYGEGILVSGETFAEVMHQVEARCIPAVPIRGKTRSLDLFALDRVRPQALPAALTTRLNSSLLW